MPYIKQDKREFLVEDIEDEVHGKTEVLWIHDIKNAGEVQYAIAVIIKSYIERKGLKYQHCNDILGALAGAQMEFYRRTVVPYEDEKIKENGDV